MAGLERIRAALGWAMVASLPISCGPPGSQLAEWPGGQWARHTIDDSSFGADGVRLADANGDGRLDIVSPWEQGGRIRIYFNPGASGLRDRWPAVTVGEVGDPEDAFFVDLDGDGALDVVSLCEGETRSIFVHWAPADRSRLTDSAAWTTAELPAASGMAQWMFGLAMQVDGQRGVDLIASAKNEGAQIGWFESPEDPRRLADWKWHPLYDAGWVMTVRKHDMDSDGDMDLVATDRTGPGRGALWLENPWRATSMTEAWIGHRIGPMGDYEAMHNAIADLDGDGRDDVLVAVKGGPIRFHRRTGAFPATWETREIEMPPQSGTGKSVKVVDIDLDGRLDLVVGCEHATEGKIGVFWLSHLVGPTDTRWSAHSISGPEGFIYDLIQLTDLDGDGDLDLVTLEEKGPYLADGYQGKELGVVWYENPSR